MTPEPEVPLSRLAGRASRRWWHRNAPGLRRASQPVRRGWASLMGYVWIVGFVWVGVLLAVGTRNLSGAESPWALVVGVGGGLLLGWTQARHRMARHLDRRNQPPRWFTAAIWTWLALTAAAATIGT